MVFQMRHVIAHEIVEGRWLGAGNRFPRKLVEIMTCPQSNTFVFRDSLHDTRDVEVVAAPERNQLFPGRVPISLHGNPRVLFVTRKDQILLKLCPHETLMIVGCRVDQVSNHLSGAPLARTRSETRPRIAHSLKDGRGLVDRLAKYLNVLEHVDYPQESSGPGIDYFA